MDKLPNRQTSLTQKLSRVYLFGLFLLVGFAALLHILLKTNNILFILATLLIAAIIFGFGVYFINFFISPLKRLLESLPIFIKGELDHRLNIHTGDEIEVLANALNELAKKISGHVEGANNTQTAASSTLNKAEIILSSIQDGIIVLDLNKKVFLANSSAEKLTGWNKDEMLGKSIDELIKLTDNLNQVLLAENYVVVDTGQGEESKVFGEGSYLNLLGKGNVKTYVKLTSTPISSAIHSDLGSILILKDTSKQKEFESMQLDFVSMSSHELRTPLTSIKGYLSVFIDENKSKLNAEQKDFMDRMMISVQQLSSLVDNLLNVSKVERGALTTNLQEVDWTSILQQTVKDNQLQAEQKNISLTLELPKKDLPKINVDPVRIQEVLNNLLNNAIAYTQEGGKIVVSSEVKDDNVVTSITDNGKGIPQDALPHLFTKFFRVQGALDQSSNSKGTGLGLFLSKSIIDMHGGKIWAESPGPGKGSTFFFSISSSFKLPFKPSSCIVLLNLSMCALSFGFLILECLSFIFICASLYPKVGENSAPLSVCTTLNLKPKYFCAFKTTSRLALFERFLLYSAYASLEKTSINVYM